MVQHEILTIGELLNNKGHLNEPGFSRQMIQHYNRECCGKNALHIKEWDYYLIGNGKYSIALTIADNGYMGMISASFLDFTGNKTSKTATSFGLNGEWEQTTSIMTAFPLGKFNLPSHSKAGTTKFSNKKCDFCFTAEPTNKNYKANRILDCRMDNFKDGLTFTCHIELTDEPDDSMVISTPYKDDKKAFYYNQKIIGMKANGWAQIGNFRIEFNKDDATGLLDWGRGIWTRDNTWYWGAACGYVDGHNFGWNIGYGFGDTSAASENMLFYDGKSHKLDRIRFEIPVKEGVKLLENNNDWISNPTNPKVHLDKIHDFVKPWKFTSNDGRFEMDFVPILDRSSCTDVGIIMSDQHQVFGKFTGTAILDDGTQIKIKDFFGFAEKVHNKW